MEILDALILGIVEGLTEFLPISSTGHLILASDLLGANDERGKVFDIAIQTGAVVAVIWEYRARLFRVDPKLWLNLIVAFIPAAVLGLAFGAYIKAHLFSAVPVASAFIVGGLIILLVERKKLPSRVDSTEAMTRLDALKVGVAQCFALIPGTSRSGATIIGGMLFGLSRRAATEFSFFLAVPTLLAAGAYDLWKNRALFAARDLPMFALGLAAAFVSAFVVIRWLIRYVATHDFRPFAWYRIVFGAVVLLTAYFGWVSWRA
ncbi:MAG: undecaprenyl-diphosphate phosphatase [Betaproteobacteria bacterium]|nr:MAG: undecaprenyl-diphosphate phosphatase [Betaproteobacteria bacterium]TMI02605.1 MAG: undecaprenyl-diphosphate phosphatase [Betaproteobacteria bacterium]TMI12898.1 MAG: undecaprenyl-diphosphate phosphatase [Betaproteobacteria bacterium]